MLLYFIQKQSPKHVKKMVQKFSWPDNTLSFTQFATCCSNRNVMVNLKPGYYMRKIFIQSVMLLA